MSEPVLNSCGLREMLAERGESANGGRREEALGNAKKKTDCRQEPGALVPVVDRNRCEGKRDCVEACPYDVFEIRSIGAEERRGLSIIGRLKAFAHGGQQAFAVHAEACRGCGLCVTACPERAITLRPRTA